MARTALEHVYALAILSQEGQEGLDFLMDWTARMRAKKIRRMLQSGHGDEEDRSYLEADRANMIEMIGREKFAMATVQELVDRAKLQDFHSFHYSQLNCDSHFDTSSVLEIAYANADIPVEFQESLIEDVCRFYYQLLSVLIGVCIAARDMGMSALAGELERAAAIKSELEPVALQVDDIGA